MAKRFYKLVIYTIYIIVVLLGANIASATEPPLGLRVGAVVSGSVVDDDGKPMPYATIFVDGTTRGTTTDAEGRYELHVEAGDAEVVI